MKPNYKALRSVVALCRKLKVDELAVLRFVTQGRGKDHQHRLDLSYDEFQELLHEIVQLKKEVGNFIQIRTGCPMNFCSLIDKTLDPVRCKAGLSTLLIHFDGKVTPCPAFKQAPEFYLGNIHNQSLTDIWTNNPVLKRLRQFKFEEIKGCSACSDLHYCQGRCIAQRFYEHGDIYIGPDPLCPKYQEQQLLKDCPASVHAIK